MITYLPQRLAEATFPDPTNLVSQTIIKSNTSIGILDAYGNAKPADTTKGYAPGCIFRDVIGAVVYINTGTVASCTFKAVTHA